MNNYGTWATFDCPTKKVREALAWLQAEFKKIDAKVWQKINPHDFGSYPSFEINYPDKLVDIDSDEIYKDDNDQRLAKEKENWHNKANKIQEKYDKKFSNYL